MISSPVPHLISLDKKGNSASGYLSVLEAGNCPFEIRRVYWVYGTPAGITRGHHAFRNLTKLLIAVAGRVSITTESVKGEKEHFLLESPSTALFLPEYHWIVTQFSADAVLMVLASAEFSENEHIRDYAQFRKGQE